MNSALLLGQLALLAALVPTIYLANFYYKAYHAEWEKGKRINAVLVLDKYYLVTELESLRAQLEKTAGRGDRSTTSDLLRMVAAKIQLVLDGNKRRLAAAKQQVL